MNTGNGCRNKRKMEIKIIKLYKEMILSMLKEALIKVLIKIINLILNNLTINIITKKVRLKT